jgi:hypothetical protein
MEKDGADKLDRLCERLLHKAKEKGNILHTVKLRNANWIGHILNRNCLINTLLKGRSKGRENEEEDVSTY